MGKFDYNNYVVEVKIRENVTDKRYYPWMEKNDFSLSDYIRFEESLSSRAKHHTAEKIVGFFVNYKSGILLPDKYDLAEPIRKVFNPLDITIPVSYISYPAGELDLLKRRRYTATIKNDTFAIIFEKIPGKGYMVLPTSPKATLPEYLTSIRFLFPIHKNTDIQFLVDLMHDLKAYLNADYGKVYIQSNNEIIAE